MQARGEESYLKHIARYNDVITAGAVNFNHRTGQCGPVQATMTRSWGAACPPGFCPPENLPEAINRYFAGDRSGCREIPWTVRVNATEDAALVVTATVSSVSKVTMCPTRLLARDDDVAGGAWRISVIQFGNQNQIVGGPVHLEMFGSGAFQTVPMVPDCLRAGQPFTITLTLQPDATPVARSAWLTFIGPMVG